MLIEYKGVYINPDQIITIEQQRGQCVVFFSTGRSITCEREGAWEVAAEINLLAEEYLENPQIKRKKEADEKLAKEIGALKSNVTTMSASDAVCAIYDVIPYNRKSRHSYDYISVRGINTLNANKISFVELIKMTPSDLLRIPHLGRKTFNEIDYALRAIKINLRDNVNYN